MGKHSQVVVLDKTLRIQTVEQGEYISLTDIAFEFATWIFIEFKFYLLKEFQRLKEHEQATHGSPLSLTQYRK